MTGRQVARRPGLARLAAIGAVALAFLATAGFSGAYWWSERDPAGSGAEPAKPVSAPVPPLVLTDPAAEEVPGEPSESGLPAAKAATFSAPNFQGEARPELGPEPELEPEPEPSATIPEVSATAPPTPDDATIDVSVPPPAPAAPEKAAGDVPLWLKNAVPLNWDRRRPAIAIVIDDLGVDRRRSERVVKLPSPLTLAWLPYAGDVGRQAAAARAAGHELLLHMPMEPQGKQDPGPGAMLTALTEQELQRRLEAAFASFEGYIGLNNHMGSRFTENRRGMDLVTAELRRRGLLFLDSVTTARSVGVSAARDASVPSVGRDVFIDHDMRPEMVSAALARIEAVARKKGWAIGIGHPHDVTIKALAEWLPTLEERGFSLVPVSAIVKALH